MEQGNLVVLENTQFSIEKFKEQLPQIKKQIFEEISPDSHQLITSLDESDLMKIYGEWRIHGKTNASYMQTGFVFEILCQRYLKSSEANTPENQAIEDILLFLCEQDNMKRLWNHERSNPDGLEVADNNGRKEVTKIFESKMSTKSSFDTRQKNLTLENIKDLINVLNGDNIRFFDASVRMKTLSSRIMTVIERGGSLLAQGARSEYLKHTQLPLAFAENCRYIYLFPSDYKPELTEKNKEYFNEYINIPVSSEEVNKIREIIMSHLTSP